MTQEDLDKWAELDPWGRFVKQVLADPDAFRGKGPRHLDCVAKEGCKTSSETSE